MSNDHKLETGWRVHVLNLMNGANVMPDVTLVAEVVTAHIARVGLLARVNTHMFLEVP